MAIGPSPLLLPTTWLAGLLGAFGLWLANRVMGKAAFQTAINEGFSSLLSQVRAENAELHGELVIKNKRIEQLEGQVRELQQLVQSLRQRMGLIDGEEQ